LQVLPKYEDELTAFQKVIADLKWMVMSENPHHQLTLRTVR
jgi:hypothetical protein